MVVQVNSDGYKMVNVYKPPLTRLQASDLPVFPHHCLYADDHTRSHNEWGYGANSADGGHLADWASN